MENKNVNSDAAPDLYEALNAIVAFWDVAGDSSEQFVRMLRDSGFIEHARAALAKYRGEA